MVEIADDFPDKYLVYAISGEIKTKRNFIAYYAKSYQAKYLAGLVAGGLTKTNAVGLVCSFPASVVFHRVNAFTLGVIEANPDAKVYIAGYVGGWYDPPTEREIAEKLVDEYNVDVLSNIASDSAAPSDVANEKGIWFIGKDVDVVKIGWGTTDYVACSYKDFWEVFYDALIKDYLAGNEYPRNVYFQGMDEPLFTEEGPVYITDIVNDGKAGADSISPKAKAIIGSDGLELIEMRRNQIIDGTFDPFTYYALVNTDTGVVEKPAGVMPTKEYLLSGMTYYIEGVVPPE